MRPIAYGTGLTLSTDGKLRIIPITNIYEQEIVIVERKGRDVTRWSISRSMGQDCCLNRDGQWEIEPIPSSRHEEFYRRCRFDNHIQASAFLLVTAEASR